MKSKEFLDWLGCGIGTVLTAVQTQEVFQIISLVLTCIATIATIAFNIYKWYKSAMADGKLDEKEINEGINLLNDSVKQIEELSKEEDKGDK